MNSSDIALLATALGSVIFLVVLIVSRIRLHPLLALVITSIGVGPVTGMPGEKLIKSIEAGAGHTLGAVGLVVALGAMLARILAAGGVTENCSHRWSRRIHHSAPRFWRSSSAVARCSSIMPTMPVSGW